MILRIWHGYTTHEKADAYEKLLKENIFPLFEGKNVPGYRGIELLKRFSNDEFQFITIMWFDTLQYSGNILSPKPTEV